MSRLTGKLAAAYLRRRVKPLLAGAQTLDEAAAILERAATLAPTGAMAPLAPIPSADADAARPRLLYLHGGAFFCGSPALYQNIVWRFEAHGFAVTAPAYRLAPHCPFPAALEDARAAYDALASIGPGPLALAGDSAGGGLALALMIALRECGAPRPCAAALFSPWTDLAASGASIRTHAQTEALFTRAMLKTAARAYLSGASPKNPLASPLYGDLAGLPPLLLHVGANEILRDDSLRLADKAKSCGVLVETELFPDVPHGWQFAVGALDEADRSLDAAARFLMRHAAG